ncbi:Carboxynorspermidine/carboxyspermidine decarboxylase [BD1-7 clade bacterium]|uniref:Carboxynorspermidine/carboxyspermidine decarboxylase n=1 Tax=BD1-7 clade bacterium TaxID=2029982 RepID=A0A5S9PGI9_9GAMM|nr:Carboxynorspermidine/carboxyspermidine decarboxylase [BD1-7 clade bacterium]
MKATTFKHFDPTRTPSPCFVIDKAAVEKNLQCLRSIEDASGARILLALKAFAMPAFAPLVRQYLHGCCASGLHEALLAHEHFGGRAEGADKREVHVYSPAYSESEFESIIAIADHIVFNSIAQWQRFQSRIIARQRLRPGLKVGLRINPMVSTGDTAIYDPCAAGSRLGSHVELVKRQLATATDLNGISGLHFHTLCEQGYAPLVQTLDVVEAQFGDLLPHMEWLNLGGGHHITAPDYDRQGLIAHIRYLQDKYQLQVYLEPGEAAVINSGVLVSEVLDLHENDHSIAILDTSATCHMPDTLEMPYRPDILIRDSNGAMQVATAANATQHNYRLGGQTCLAGDVIGDYSFMEPLVLGQRVMFDDMAHYTLVKTTTFNGIRLPSLAVWDSETDTLEVVKSFGYEDFASRLG